MKTSWSRFAVAGSGRGADVLSVLLLVAILAVVTIPVRELASTDDLWFGSAPRGVFDLSVIYAAAGRYLGAAIVHALSLSGRPFADFVPALQGLFLVAQAVFAVVFVTRLRRDLPVGRVVLFGALVLVWPYNVDLYIFKVLYPNLIAGFAALALALAAHPRRTLRADLASVFLVAAVQGCYQPLAYYYPVFVAARMLVGGFDWPEFRRAGLRFLGGVALYGACHLLLHAHFLELARRSLDPLTLEGFARDRGGLRTPLGMLTGVLEYGYIVLRSLGAAEPIAGWPLKLPLLATVVALGWSLLRQAGVSRAARATSLAALGLLVALMGSPFQILIDYDSFPPRTLTHVGAVFAALCLALSVHGTRRVRHAGLIVAGFAAAVSATAFHLVLRDGVAVGEFDRRLAREISGELAARGDVQRVRFVNLLPDRPPALESYVIYYNINLSAFSRPWSNYRLLEAAGGPARESADAPSPVPDRPGPTGAQVHEVVVRDGVAFVYFNQAELPRGESAFVERLRAFKRGLQAR